MRKFSLYCLIIFYCVAGINHFINPSFYIPLIPDYLTMPKSINVVSGFLEIALAIGLVSDKFRKPASIGISILLVLFIPSHIHFIQNGSCIPNNLCVSPFLAWIRLIVVHPLLICWALYAGKLKTIRK